jgi:hypothetical protein
LAVPQEPSLEIVEDHREHSLVGKPIDAGEQLTFGDLELVTGSHAPGAVDNVDE